MGRVDRVVMAGSWGFCAGVRMAIEALEVMLDRYSPPIYCYHEIVHNDVVIEGYRRRGVVFFDDLESVPPEAPILLSAHGSSPEVIERAKERSDTVIDAVCPMVAKVHRELRSRSAEGYHVVYVGHAGHDEVMGTLAEAKGVVDLVDGPDDLEHVDPAGAPVAVLSQTTLSETQWQDVMDEAERRFGSVWTPARNDLCFATTNRQHAIVDLSRHVDAIVVVGSASSSNTAALVRAARESGCDTVVRVDGPDELPAELGPIVGVSAGASTPERQVWEIVEALNPVNGIEYLPETAEEAEFALPKPLREPARR